MKIKFALKDAQASLIKAIGDILGQQAVCKGVSTITQSAGGYIVKCIAKKRVWKGAEQVNIRFNVASGGRKAFARAVGGILGCDVVYNGTPSFAYTIGRYTVDREGALICPADMDCEEVNRLIGALHKRGYEAEEIPDYNTLQMTEREELWLGRERRDPIGEDRMQPSDVLDSDENRLVIEVPIADFPEYAYANLGNIVASKNRLIKKALGTDSLRIDIDDEKMAFPWFTLTGAEGEADAYLRFITALCKMAKEQKRVTAKERPLENDKFAMRYG